MIIKSPHLLTRREFATATTAAAVASAAVSPGLFAQGGGEKRFRIIGFTKPFQNLNFEETANTVAEIGWDGGITADNAAVLVTAGVRVLNVGGYIQKADDPQAAYAKLKVAIKH